MKHALERIDRNAHAQARLVQDLLDVSRITSGKLLLDIREMDLATVALNAIDACRPAAEARQVALVTEFGGTFPTMGDPDRLQQVLWNLITNAVRFTPADGSVNVSIARADETDTIEVRDTGAGIEPQFIPFMFEPFRQADAASTRSHGGLGIGLTIVRRLTEMHGGTVSVASEGAGKGATLTVTLPVRRPAAGRDRAVGTSASASRRWRRPPCSSSTTTTTRSMLLESTLRLAGATADRRADRLPKRMRALGRHHHRRDGQRHRHAGTGRLHADHVAEGSTGRRRCRPPRVALTAYARPRRSRSRARRRIPRAPRQAGEPGHAAADARGPPR